LAETPPGEPEQAAVRWQRFVHDLNNILGAGLVNVDLLRERLAPESPLMEIVDDLKQSLEQAHTLMHEAKTAAAKLKGL
jgi:hypothetical protein